MQDAYQLGSSRARYSVNHFVDIGASLYVFVCAAKVVFFKKKTIRIAYFNESCSVT